ncbi:hypothetical protein C2S51_038175 [Perilla frutescens var. frutescens]|nr:hypothetical protein C2S51_038175 [Perilla frutescens var. frutescens]
MVVCSAAKVFVLMVCMISVVCCELPSEQVSAMTSIYEIIQNRSGAPFRWNNVLKNSNPCSWEGVGCSPDNSSINTINFNFFSIFTSEFLPFLCNIRTLEYVDVSYNYLSAIPDSFFIGCGKIRGLKHLNLGGNKLNDSLPNFNGFTMLEDLDISGNSLSGEIGLQLDGLGSLKSLDFGWNQFTGKIPTNIGKMNLLEELVLTANNFTGEIPVEMITKYKNLRVIDLSDNMLSGSIPGELGKLTRLQTLDLSGNQLSGNIPIGISNITTLQRFEANYNNLNGTIPSDLLGSLVELEYLGLSNNRLTGSLPLVLGNLTSLRYLNLRFNYFVGVVPPEISQLNLLTDLNVGWNSLNGSIPWSIVRMQNLSHLDLQGNNLCGPIPDSIGNLSSLLELQLGNNRLSGPIPDMPHTLQTTLNLSNNHFVGHIPINLLRLQRLEVLDLQGNYLSGHIPDTIRNLSSLRELQLGNNQLSGRIPDMPQSLQIALNLSYNLFHGRIPSTLSILWRLEVLDLSNNKFSGEIPYFLTVLRSLTHLLLMNNELSGVLPQFGNHVEVNISGNNYFISPTQNASPAPHRNTKIIDSDIVIAVASGIPVGLLISMLAIFISTRYKRIHGNLSTPNRIHNPNINFNKAMEAVADPSNITLKTTFSTFYKAVMPSGTAYLAKKVSHSNSLFLFPRHEQLVEELEVVGKLSNSNVMIPVAYVLTVRRAYLFYDFVRGTLHDILHHRMGSTLEWASRYNIAVKVAQGLAYLHECSSGPIILLDLCSKSILLKSVDEPQISDIELCNLIHPSKTKGSLFTAADSLGYAPPEYACTKRVTAAGNVYSFGVVLLELVTGKPAVNGGTELAKWVSSSSEQQDKWDEILDSGVSETSVSVRNQMLAVLEVALACISISPEMRPNTVTMVQMLLSKRSHN